MALETPAARDRRNPSRWHTGLVISGGDCTVTASQRAPRATLDQQNQRGEHPTALGLFSRIVRLWQTPSPTRTTDDRIDTGFNATDQIPLAAHGRREINYAIG